MIILQLSAKLSLIVDCYLQYLSYCIITLLSNTITILYYPTLWTYYIIIVSLFVVFYFFNQFLTIWKQNYIVTVSKMALNGEKQRLSEQLRHAMEMGYTDSEVWAALELHNKENRDKVRDLLPNYSISLIL